MILSIDHVFTRFNQFGLESKLEDGKMAKSTISRGISAGSAAAVVLDLTEKPLIRVLHVDDEISFSKVVKQYLEMQGGFQIDIASSVEEAMEKIEKETYDVVVSDCQMPKKDGLNLLRELREKGNTIPFIVCTGKGREEVAIDALNLGADQYLDKTGDPQTVCCKLAHCIRQAVEKERAERLLRESEALLRQITDNMLDMISLSDDKGIFKYVSPSHKRILGYETRELLGKSFFEFMHPDDLDAVMEAIQRAKRNHYWGKMIFRFRHADGHYLRLECVGNFICDGNDQVVGAVLSTRDITVQNEVEKELEESRRHFQTLFNLMVDPVAIVDGKGKILEVTQRAEEVTGFKREELLGKNFLKTKILSAKSKAILIKNLAKRMMGMHIAPYEVEVLTKDGRKLPHEINATRIEYKGKPADLVVFRDVSERKKMEEKLRVVGSLTRHDVRNKLSVLTGNVFLAKKRLAGNDEVSEYLREIESGCQQIVRILEFSKDYEMLGVEELTYIDVNETFEKAISLFSNLDRIRIENECRGLVVLADSLLRQVFYNLVDNSLKHGEKVGRIRVHYEEAGKDQLRLVYEDDGVGVPFAEKPKLFKEGYGRGTGYGLFMIKRICEVYGWSIQETGEPCKGARFTMTISRTNQEGKQNYQLRRRF